MTHGGTTLANVMFDNSLPLLAGTVGAVVWANLDLASDEQLARPLLTFRA